MAAIAPDLDIHPNNLYKWHQTLVVKVEEAYPGYSKLSKSDEVDRHLRRELEQVLQERDILKNALLFFTKENK